jgi:N,N'-diacetylchitobiose transport system permease protein
VSGPSLPGGAAAAEISAQRSRRWRTERLAHGAAPYALLGPAAIVMAAILAYPIYYLTTLSFQRYGLPELIRHEGTWIGLDNFGTIVHDAQFWRVLLRTVVFTIVNVGLTMVLGTLIALLLAQLGSAMRLLLTTGLVLVWSMPVVVAVNIWAWMVDFEFGVANWALTELHLGDFVNHDWFENPISGFGVITALIVWGAIPFVAITVYAGLSQVPQELVEAAAIDGATGARVFRDVTLPLLKPIFVILTSLSVIWDFQVFNQIWLIRNSLPASDYYTMSVYAYVTSFSQANYGLGSAIALVMVAIMLAVTFVYIRQMIRIGEVR